MRTRIAVKLSNIACSFNLHYLMLSRGNSYAEKQHSNSFAFLAARGPVIMPHV